MSWFRRVRNRLRFESHWRCAEPVVVIESDDWGLDRRPCAELLTAAGQPTDWAAEATETAADVETLADLLLGHRDEFGQAACVTANFVMTNPDLQKIRESGFEAYESVPLDAGLPAALLPAYRGASSAGCFLPQYHGLRHFSPSALLRDLRSGAPHARILFDAGAPMGLSFLKGQLWRYHSEYEDWNGGGPPYRDTPAEDLRTGLDCFERCFGFRAASTMPPHYLWTDAVQSTLRYFDIRYLQGADYRLRREGDGTAVVSSSYLGFTDDTGAVHLCRTARLEPRPGRPEDSAKALRQAERLFESGVPVVLDTHRINYTGHFRDRGLSGLREFLNGVARFRPRFLTSEQLGDAIVSGGAFEIRGGGIGRLTPVRNLSRNAARTALAFS